MSARTSEGHASSVLILKLVPEAKRTEPSRHLYQGAQYVPAAQTDIRKTLAQLGFVFRSAA